MRRLYSFLLSFLFILSCFSQNTGIGVGTASPHPSAALEINDSIRGFLPPRMTYSQRNSIINPAAGLIIFCTDCGTVGEMQYFNGYQWKDMTMGEGSSPIIVNTLPVSNIRGTTAIGNGIFSSVSLATYTAFGVCWSTSPNPTILLETKAIGNIAQGGTQFTANITGLLPNTIYYVRAFVTNSNYDQNWGNGAAYGQELTFTTSADITPVVNTMSISDIYSYSALCTASVSDSGGLSVTSRGFCWSRSPNPTIQSDTKKQVGSGIGNFTTKIPNLRGNTTYYLRPYATNAAGTSYGTELVFTTLIPYTLGQLYAGGIICYVDSTGQHGMIAAPKDTVLNGWGCSGVFTSGTSLNFGSGSNNTAFIISNCTDPNGAAKFCDQLVLNGYDDWFLPSVNEIKWLYYLYDGVYVSFPTIPLSYEYASSSEFDANQIYMVDGYYSPTPIGDGYLYSAIVSESPSGKNQIINLRPFRKF